MKTRTLKLLAATLLFGLLVAAPPAVAALQQRTVAAPEQLAGDGFEPVSSLPATQETLPAAPMVMAAYGFVWLMVMAYLWTIWRRLGTVQRELESVARRVDDLQRK